MSIETRPGAHLTPGLTFIDPHQITPEEPTGPEIVDNRGRVVWYHPLPAGVSVANFEVQTYEGEPVLTWWQGTGGNPAFGALAAGIGEGEDIIMNMNYKVIARIGATDGFIPDSHEFTLTPDGKALITGYQNVPGVNLTSVHGSSSGTVIDSLVREVDVKTGKVVFDWSALAHVPITDSHALPLFGNSPWDYFHVNSVGLAPNGNLLISGRHVWALYEVDPKTGAVVSTIGGKESSWTFGPGAAFAWQHDARFLSPEEISLFDNEEGIPFGHVLPYSRALRLHLDYATHTATVTREILQPSDQHQTSSQGSVQYLPGGRVLVGWGSAGTYSEYSRTNAILMRGKLPPTASTVTVNGQPITNAWSSYRVSKGPWRGEPSGHPVLSVEPGSDGRLTVSAAWNGETGISYWKVLAGTAVGDLTRVKTKSWNGLITTFVAQAPGARYVQVQAIGEKGEVLGSSPRAALSKG